MIALLGKWSKMYQVHEQDKTGQVVFLTQGIQLPACNAARQIKLAESPFIHKATSLHILSVSL